MSGAIIKRVREREIVAIMRRDAARPHSINWMDLVSASMNRQCYYPPDPPWALLLRRRICRVLLGRRA